MYAVEKNNKPHKLIGRDSVPSLKTQRAESKDIAVTTVRGIIGLIKMWLTATLGNFIQQ